MTRRSQQRSRALGRRGAKPRRRIYARLPIARGRKRRLASVTVRIVRRCANGLSSVLHAAGSTIGAVRSLAFAGAVRIAAAARLGTTRLCADWLATVARWQRAAGRIRSGANRLVVRLAAAGAGVFTTAHWLTGPRISAGATVLLAVLAAASVLLQLHRAPPRATAPDIRGGDRELQLAGGEYGVPSEARTITRYRPLSKVESVRAPKSPVRQAPQRARALARLERESALPAKDPLPPDPVEEDLAAAMPSLALPEGIDDGLDRGADDDALLPALPQGKPQFDVPPWLAYAVDADTTQDGPMIAIVIDDVGIDQARTARAVELPAPLTLAFIPYGRDLASHTTRARAQGHELLVHMPMEPSSAAADPGPNALLTSLDDSEIMRRMRWGLSRFEGYVGVSNHMGSLFMADPELVRPLMREIRDRGLLFLDSWTRADTAGTGLAEDLGVPNTRRDVFLDNERTVEEVSMRLAQLEAIARRKGYAVGLGHPHDVTLDVLAEWIPEARRRGINLVPVSTVVRLSYQGTADSLLAAAAGGEANGLFRGPQ